MMENTSKKLFEMFGRITEVLSPTVFKNLQRDCFNLKIKKTKVGDGVSLKIHQLIFYAHLNSYELKQNLI